MKDKRIMLIEDNPDDIELTLRVLRKNNVTNEVIIARDGEEAISLLVVEKKIAPSVILLDLKLPKIDGLEVLKRIRSDQRTRLVPVVILTSSKEEEDIVNGYSNGANSYIRKPVSFEEFVDVMRSLSSYWLNLNEPPPKI